MGDIFLVLDVFNAVDRSPLRGGLTRFAWLDSFVGWYPHFAVEAGAGLSHDTGAPRARCRRS
ncbi:MAG TPA: hypothetical protein PLG60_03710 [Acidimicrobiales bacterium]|nr:MAG: hypothetical protein B7X07_01115 [Actinobacteria bacterium 21-64-8]HQT99590.1 hypothetical protein [Acidimicrobiales bacterium]